MEDGHATMVTVTLAHDDVEIDRARSPLEVRRRRWQPAATTRGGARRRLGFLSRPRRAIE